MVKDKGKPKSKTGAVKVKITGRIEAHKSDTCSFTVEEPVYPGKSAVFNDSGRAKGSPLAESLFNISGVSALKIAGNVVRVTRTSPEDWKTAAGPIAAVIRKHLKSGKPAVAAGFKDERMSDEKIRAKVQDLFDREITPALAGHGGVAELVEVKDGSIYVRLGGGCQGCGMAQATLRQGIERTIREKVPEVDEVLDATDHASGKNPYYAK